MTVTATPIKNRNDADHGSGELVSHIYLAGSNGLVNNGRVSLAVGSDMEVSGVGNMTVLAAVREPGGVRLTLGPESTPREAWIPNEVILVTLGQPSGPRPRAA